MKMKKMDFFIIGVTWINIISLDFSILAHVEYANGFSLRELFLKNNVLEELQYLPKTFFYSVLLAPFG